MAEVKKKGTTKRRGRPATGRDPPFSMRIPPETRRRAEKLAKEKGVTLAKAILSVLDKHLPKGEE
jgi:predicted DNA-binding protein